MQGIGAYTHMHVRMSTSSGIGPAAINDPEREAGVVVDNRQLTRRRRKKLVPKNESITTRRSGMKATPDLPLVGDSAEIGGPLVVVQNGQHTPNPVARLQLLPVLPHAEAVCKCHM